MSKIALKNMSGARLLVGREGEFYDLYKKGVSGAELGRFFEISSRTARMRVLDIKFSEGLISFPAKQVTMFKREWSRSRSIGQVNSLFGITGPISRHVAHSLNLGELGSAPKSVKKSDLIPAVVVDLDRGQKPSSEMEREISRAKALLAKGYPASQVARDSSLSHDDIVCLSGIKPKRSQYLPPKIRPKPRLEIKKTEHQIQVEIVNYLRATLIDAVVASVPNQRINPSFGGLTNLKREGMIPGFPDLVIYQGGKAFFIEVKAKNGRLSENQSAVLERFLSLGFKAAVCRSVDEARAFVSAAGITTRETQTKL